MVTGEWNKKLLVLIPFLLFLVFFIPGYMSFISGFQGQTLSAVFNELAH